MKRRDFLLSGAAVIALAPLAVVAYPGFSEYVVFPHPSWKRDDAGRFWLHGTKWGDSPRYGLGCCITDMDIAEGRVPMRLEIYNRVLENVRRKHGFSRDTIYRAARRA